MRRLGTGSFVLLATCLLTPPAFGIGADHQIDQDGNIRGAQSPDWPSGLAGLINSGPVFHGHWVNANSEFFYLGDTASLTRFLKRYATLKNTPLVVVIHAGSARRSELWGEKPKERYDWKVLVLRRGRGAPEKADSPDEKWVVTVHVWIDRSVRLGELVVPGNVNVESGGEIETFIGKHKVSHLSLDALRSAALRTSNRVRAKGPSLLGSGEIPPELWDDYIRKLKPIRVYHHVCDLVIVLNESTDLEAGLYVAFDVSSYAVRCGKGFLDDGFSFAKADGQNIEVYRFRRKKAKR